MSHKRGLTGQEISHFCAQTAMMLGAGMMLADGMEAVAGTYENTPRAEVYAQLARVVTETGSLREALAASDAFPAYMVEMTGIGERIGNLEDVMQGLSAYYAREHRIRKAVTGAVVYPAVLGVMMAVIVLVMVWKVLPLFDRVLSNMGIVMTASGNAMMTVGTHIGRAALMLVGIGVLLVIVCAALLRTRKRDAVLSLLKKLFPPFARMSAMITCSRISSVLSMMLSAGFAPDEALRLMPGILDDASARAKVQQMYRQMEGGTRIADALVASELFDPLYVGMIRTGFRAGCADRVMQRVAGDYEEKAEDAIARLVSIIEPSLVGVLAVVIGAVLLSVMLPMMGVISAML